MKWRLCDCGTPMLSWCRLCARQTDRDIDRLLGTYDATGRELQPDQLPVGWTRPGEGALRTDMPADEYAAAQSWLHHLEVNDDATVRYPQDYFPNMSAMMAALVRMSAEAERILLRGEVRPELGAPYRHPHHVHDDPVMVFIGGPWEGVTEEVTFTGSYLTISADGPGGTGSFMYMLIGGLHGARRNYALSAGINPTKWAGHAVISDRAAAQLYNGADVLQRTLDELRHNMTAGLAQHHLTPLLPTYEVDWFHDEIRCVWDVRALVLALPR